MKCGRVVSSIHRRLYASSVAASCTHRQFTAGWDSQMTIEPSLDVCVEPIEPRIEPRIFGTVEERLPTGPLVYRV